MAATIDMRMRIISRPAHGDIPLHMALVSDDGLCKSLCHLI